ncbi:hypothetical protein HY639_05325 [Candidatus Woesearchaeota archaeon]|nr:hypothetical protein [Candidatus Woesearchaeota archaeon]
MVTVASYIVGLLLTASGILKMTDLKGFRRIVAFYGILPRWLLTPAAYALPFVETGTGLALLVMPQKFYPSLVAEIILLNAVAFLVVGLVKKKKMDNCGCFGTSFKIPLSWWEVAEDLLWISINTYILVSVW